MRFINLTPFIPLSTLGEGEGYFERGASAPLQLFILGGLPLSNSLSPALGDRSGVGIDSCYHP